MIQSEFKALPEQAESFRARLAAQEWDQTGEQLVEALATTHDTVVGILGQMSVYHGTLPSLVEGIRTHGLRGDYEVLTRETLTTFDQLLHRHVDVNRPDIAQRLRLHHFRPNNPVYVATDKSVAEIYGFPESSRFILQGLVHVSQLGSTSKSEGDELLATVNQELDRLLEGDGDTTTAVVELDIAHPSILPNITNVEHVARLSEAAEHIEPRIIAKALGQHNLPVYGEIPASAITDVDYIERDFGTWRDIVISGRGQSIFN